MALTALVVVGMMVLPDAARSESGSLFRKSHRGLNMSVDTRWVDAGGYRPVRIRFTPTVTSPVDRTLLVEFTIGDGRRPDENTMVVQQNVIIPAGRTPVATTLSVPQLGPWAYNSVRVYEAGDELRGLTSAGIPTGIDRDDWQEGWPSVLFVGNASPDASELGRALRVPGEAVTKVDAVGVEQDTRLPNSPAELPTGVTLSVGELPQRWIDYSCLDIVCLSLADVRKLASARPQSWDAIRRWTAAGGNLFVYGVGDSVEGQRELARALDLRSEDQPSDDAEDQLWRKPRSGDYDVRLSGYSYEPTELTFMGRLIESPFVDEQKKPPQTTTSPPAKPTFVWRTYQRGAVVALYSAEPFPGESAEWGWILNTLGTDRWTWFQRHGVTVRRENTDFWNFLIPGVGSAPVTEFRVLITLFVLLIGPVNYFLLQRRGKVHLIVLTVPTFAAAITLTLFLYGLVSDGLSVRVRPRSFTEIDQSSGQTVCWSRLSYYAGLAPGGGLTFSDDVMVVPIEQFAGDNYRGSTRPTRHIRWGQEQRLDRGWLPSRSPTQLLTVRSGDSELGLKITEANPAGSAGAVHNALGTRIHDLFVVGEAGQSYWSEDIESDADGVLAPIDYRQAIIKLKAISDAFKPEVPPGVNPTNRNSLFGFGRRRWWGWPGDTAVPASMATSRLEDGISWTDDPARWMNKAAGGALNASVYRTYIAIVEESPQVEYGVDDARREAGFHVIRGQW